MVPPLQALAGGVLIGLSALVLLVFNGRIAGVSGVLAGLISPRTTTFAWRAAFVGGLLAGGFGAWLVAPAAFGAPVIGSPVIWIAGGLLVGIGTRVGGGCTSGHGVCGIGRLSRRSFVATMTFMATAVATVLVLRLTGGLA